MRRAEVSRQDSLLGIIRIDQTMTLGSWGRKGSLLVSLFLRTQSNHLRSFEEIPVLGGPENE
jgi:hypothetical protein